MCGENTSTIAILYTRYYRTLWYTRVLTLFIVLFWYSHYHQPLVIWCPPDWCKQVKYVANVVGGIRNSLVNSSHIAMVMYVPCFCLLYTDTNLKHRRPEWANHSSFLFRHMLVEHLTVHNWGAENQCGLTHKPVIYPPPPLDQEYFKMCFRTMGNILCFSLWYPPLYNAFLWYLDIFPHCVTMMHK